MPSLAMSQALSVRVDIEQLSKERQRILYSLLKLQEKYKFISCLYVFSFTILERKKLKRIKSKIDRMYGRFPTEANLLKEMYEKTLF